MKLRLPQGHKGKQRSHRSCERCDIPVCRFSFLCSVTLCALVTMRVLTAAQMREADRRTTDDIGIPSLVLMENAGRQAVAAMEAMHSDLLERQVAVLCGHGNNGGDGFVVARTLMQ